jgi:hypothetical protein
MILRFLGSITRKNRGLNGSTVGNSPIGVDAFVRFLAIEIMGDQFDDTGDTSTTTDENNFVDPRFVDFRKPGGLY